MKDSMVKRCSGDPRRITSFIEIEDQNDEGKEKIEGTDIPVWKIVKLHLAGSEIMDIIELYPELSEAEIRGAISYYYCNRRRMERQLSESEQGSSDES